MPLEKAKQLLMASELGLIEREHSGPPPISYIPQSPTARQKLFLDLDSEKEVFYGGAAAGGKSSALLMSALRYVDEPNYSALLLRRTYADLSKQGALMDRAKQWLTGTGASWNEQRKTWTFPSGARLAFGYLETENDKYQYQGAEYQFIGWDELSQFSESQYTYLFSRLRRLKNADIPIRMRSASNPGGVGANWVNKRFIPEGFTPDDAIEERVWVNEASDDETGETIKRYFVPARLDDNPHLDKVEYELSLSELDPVTRAQLRRGDWQISVRGDILYMYSEPHTVISWSQFARIFGSSNIPQHWRLGIFQDWGTTSGHPCVTSWFATAGANAPEINGVHLAGSVFLYRSLVLDTCTASEVKEEIYRLMEPHNEIPRTGMWEMSHEASSERLEYQRKTPSQPYSLPFVNWETGKTRGIEQLKSALTLRDTDRPHPFKPTFSGHPQLFFVVADDEYVNPVSERGLLRIRQEAPAYKWDTPKSGEVATRLVPYALFNDACFVSGTLITTDKGDVPIEQVTKDHKILTRNGYKKTKGAFLTNPSADVHTYKFSDGNSLTATRNHPILVNNSFRRIDTLRVADIIEVWKNYNHAYTPKSSRLMTQIFTATRFLHDGLFRIITTQNTMMPKTARKHYTLKSINFTRVIYQKAITFITRTLTPLTILLKTWNVSALPNTGNDTKVARQVKRFAPIWIESDRLPVNGTKAKLEENGTVRTERTPGKTARRLLKVAPNAAKTFQASTRKLNTALCGASQEIVMRGKEVLKKLERVLTVANSFQHENMPTQSAVQLVVESVSTGRRKPVYNLSVEECPEYFANKILVHNCDTVRAAAIKYFPNVTRLTFEEVVTKEIEEILPEQKLEEIIQSGDDKYLAHMITHKQNLEFEIREKIRKSQEVPRAPWRDIG